MARCDGAFALPLGEQLQQLDGDPRLAQGQQWEALLVLVGDAFDEVQEVVIQFAHDLRNGL